MVKCMSSYDLLFPINTFFRKEVSFEKGSVLLSRLGDKIHATSAFCTHYGAPLAKGVLSSDGRVFWCVVSALDIDNNPILSGLVAHGTEVSFELSLGPLVLPSSACFNVCTGDIGAQYINVHLTPFQ
jgi:Rieske [2Fe-2S] domain